jgi:glycosyltransferase involved in cell wall biosynthesis
MEFKKVSVVLATYNGEKYLEEQLNTIIEQTYPIYEIIIQDDCSYDNTWNILLNYSYRFPTLIKIFRNEKNVGFIKNFLTATLRVSGDYVAFSDQDDIWYPDKISILINTIKDKKAAISDCYVFNQKTSEYTHIYDRFNPIHLNIYKVIMIPISGTIGQFIFTSEIKKYVDFSLKHNIDPGYFRMIFAFYLNSIAITDQVLMIWRRHDSTYTKNHIIHDIKKIRNIKGYKTLYCMYCLIRGRKSRIIYGGFEHRYKALSLLDSEFEGSDEMKKLINICKQMMNQSFFGYLRAALLCVSIRYELFDYKGYRISKLIPAFTYIYRMWFDFREDFY